MIHPQNTQQFRDISAILHTDVDIEFSACNLLGSDDYLMLTPIRQQKLMKNKQNTKHHKNSHKKSGKQLHILPKNINQSPSKSKKKLDIQKMEVSQKDTRDNSENVMKSLSIQSPKGNAFKKQRSNDNKVLLNSPKLISNKSQLNQKLRPRSISSNSTKSFQKKSSLQTGDFSKKSNCNSSIKPGKVSPGQKLAKGRSQTIKGSFEQIKLKNQNLIRNDYFQQDFTQQPEINRLNSRNYLELSPVINSQSTKNEAKSKRSCSQKKKDFFLSKNPKKTVLVAEKNGQKNQKTKKK